MSTPGGPDPNQGGSPGGFGTVVISQRVLTGREDEYRRWQHNLNGVAASFPGFISSQVSVAAGDRQRDWTVIYRFDSVPHLKGWLESSTRKSLLEGAAGLFEEPATQHVVAGEADDELVTVVVSHPVRPEDEREFLDWQARMTEAERAFPGFRGAELFRPVPGVQSSWTSIYRFGTSEELDRWLSSSEREKMLQEGAHFRDFKLRKINSSFGSWFSFAEDGDTSAAPTSWKTALSVLVGLYPTVVLLTLAVGAIWKHAPLWANLLVGNILSVSALTWVVMPLVTRALRFWLIPRQGARQPWTDALGMVVSLAFLTACALIFWLVTVVIWTLP